MRASLIRTLQLIGSPALLALALSGCSGDDDDSEAGATSVSEVTAACERFCDQQDTNGCLFIQLMGGYAKCMTWYCDMSEISNPCLAAYGTYFRCANDAPDVCTDCKDEFDAIVSCD